MHVVAGLQKRKPRYCCSDYDDETPLLQWLGATNSATAAERSCLAWAWPEGEDDRKERVKHQASFFARMKWLCTMMFSCMLCSFSMRSCSSWGLGLRNEKCLMGERPRLEKKSQKKAEGATVGIGFAAPFVFCFFSDVFSFSLLGFLVMAL